MRHILGLFILLAQAVAAQAGGGSLFAAPSEATPLFDARFQPLIRDGGGDLLSRAPLRPRLAAPLGASGIDRALFDLIASAEAGRDGYDAVQHGARIRPDKPPTAMTIGEIFDWIDRTPGQPHAIGRYQVIPSTLRELVGDLDLSRDAVFSPALQDRLALELAIGAGYTEFLEGGITREGFMANLARVWAGLPLKSGKSYYHGKWGNRATIERRTFEAGMDRIFPERGS